MSNFQNKRPPLLVLLDNDVHFSVRFLNKTKQTKQINTRTGNYLHSNEWIDYLLILFKNVLTLGIAFILTEGS